MTTKQKQIRILLASGFAVVAIVITLFTPGRYFPACDNAAARNTLGSLYDNKHLLHARDVSDLHILDNGLIRRHCSASITWENGSTSTVGYEFDRFGKTQQYLSMWIDYNGGQNGPSY